MEHNSSVDAVISNYSSKKREKKANAQNSVSSALKQFSDSAVEVPLDKPRFIEPIVSVPVETKYSSAVDKAIAEVEALL
jgi:hypothetical protein